MANIGDPLTPAVPTVGSAGPQFATDINAILTEVVARLTTKVPFSSLSNAGTLNMAGNPITNVGYMTITDVSVSPVASPVNRLTTYLGDLWYVSPSNAIKMTAGGSLNAAALGGITGDYGGANPAQFRFVDADQRYNAFDDFGTSTWGFVRARGFDIAAGATSALYARLAFGGGGTVTYTLPPSAPSVTSNLRMDSSGNITTQAPRVYAFTPTTGMIQGDGIFQINGRAPTIFWPSGVAGAKAYCDLSSALIGDTITAWSLTIDRAALTGQVDVKLWDINQTTGASSQIGATQSSTSAGRVVFSQSGLSAVITVNHSYVLEVSTPGAAGNGGTLYYYTFTVQ